MLHHIIPQSYLSGFTNDDGFLKVVDINTIHTFSSKPKGVAAQNNLYTIGNTDQSYEKHLAGLDGKIATDLRDIENNTLTDQNLAGILALISRIISYSPEMINNIRKETVKYYPYSNEYKGLPELTCVHSFLFSHFIQKLSEYNHYTLFEYDEKHHGFICSDAPYTLFNDHNLTEYVIFPINKNKVIIGCSENITIKDSTFTVPFINSATMYKSKRHIYLPNYDCEIAVGQTNLTINHVIKQEMSLRNLSQLWYKDCFRKLNSKMESDIRHRRSIQRGAWKAHLNMIKTELSKDKC